MFYHKKGDDMEVSIFFIAEFKYSSSPLNNENDYINAIENVKETTYFENTEIENKYLFSYLSDSLKNSTFKLKSEIKDTLSYNGKDDVVKVKKGSFFFVQDHRNKIECTECAINDIILIIKENQIGLVSFEITIKLNEDDKSLEILSNIIYVLKRRFCHGTIKEGFSKRLEWIIKNEGASVLNEINSNKIKSNLLITNNIEYSDPNSPSYKEKIESIIASKEIQKIRASSNSSAFVYRCEDRKENIVNLDLYMRLILKCVGDDEIKTEPFFYLKNEEESSFYVYSTIKLENTIEDERLHRMRTSLAYSSPKQYLFKEKAMLLNIYENVLWSFSQTSCAVIITKRENDESNEFIQKQMQPRLKTSFLYLVLLSRYQFASSVMMLEFKRYQNKIATKKILSALNSWQASSVYKVVSQNVQYQEIYTALFTSMKTEEIINDAKESIAVFSSEEENKREDKLSKISLVITIMTVCSILVDGKDFIIDLMGRFGLPLSSESIAVYIFTIIVAIIFIICALSFFTNKGERVTQRIKEKIILSKIKNKRKRKLGK